ncbi:MAG: UDP-N-acetylmuramate dehydrogenase [Pseudomonadota bacterium]
MKAVTVSDLPIVRGRYVANADMSALTWMRLGGPADILFTPADEEDLASFLRQTPRDILVYPVGVGSNLLVRDGGIRGVVIRLGAAFARVQTDGLVVTAGAATLDAQVAKVAARAGIAGLEFYRGIPGTIGGAIRMNAGAYGTETKDVLVRARWVDRAGEVHEASVTELGFDYRHSDLPTDAIVTEATFEGTDGDPAAIEGRMAEIMASREASQPIRERTGGSTFANPDPERSGGRSAWQLIDAIGGRARVIGDAQVSEHHCNFMINRGKASAGDMEALIESLHRDVLDQFDVDLRWEIKRIGESL